MELNPYSTAMTRRVYAVEATSLKRLQKAINDAISELECEDGLQTLVEDVHFCKNEASASYAALIIYLVEA